MNAMDARTTLLVQHELIRCLLHTCTQLAKRSLAGEAVIDELDEALGQLCHEVAAHHRAEIAMIADPAHGLAAARSDDVFGQQVAEHAALWAAMYATPAAGAERVLVLAGEIEAHLAAEEHTFLAPPIQRDPFRMWSCGLVN